MLWILIRRLTLSLLILFLAAVFVFLATEVLPGDALDVFLTADDLAVMDDEEIILNLKDDKSSCLITSNGDKDYQSIVMPMRL